MVEVDGVEFDTSWNMEEIQGDERKNVWKFMERFMGSGLIGRGERVRCMPIWGSGDRWYTGVMGIVVIRRVGGGRVYTAVKIDTGEDRSDIAVRYAERVKKSLDRRVVVIDSLG